MKSALGRWCLPADLSVDEVISLAQEAGFEGIEWPLAEHGEISLDSSDEDLRLVAEKCRKANLEICAVATGLMWQFPLTDGDAKVVEKGKSAVRRAVDAARIFGAPVILLVPGSVNQKVGYDAAWERATAAVKELSVYAGDNGVFLGIENVWNRFLLSPKEMREFIDGIGSPWVGAYFDAGNVMQYGIPEDWVRTLGSRIKAVHVKGFKLNPGGWAGFVGLMEGDNDWPALSRALREVGYEGYIIPEVGGLPEGPRATAMALAKEVAHIIACGEGGGAGA